jgi:hypothetical protein
MRCDTTSISWSAHDRRNFLLIRYSFSLQARNRNSQATATPQREISALSAESQSPSKKSIVWDTLWSLDLGGK